MTPHLAGDPERQTGRLVALIDPNGERSFFTDRGANDALRCRRRARRADRRRLAHPSLRLFLRSPAPRAKPRSTSCGAPARRRSASIRRRPSFCARSDREAFLAWTKGAAILFPNEDEAAVLAGAADPETQCARLAALYPLVVLKRGASGAVAAAGAARWRVAAPAIEALDTTGAGDAFVAAFLAARLQGAEIDTALKRAVAAGTDASTRVGGRPKGRSVVPADTNRQPG